MKKILLTSIISLICFGNIFSKTYYVSTSGNNSNSGLTQTMAWKTIAYAAGSSSPVVAGDIVYIQSGNYGAENVIFQKSGTPGKPVVFAGYKTTPGDEPPLLVDNSNPFANFLSSNMPVLDGGNRAKGTALNCQNQKYLTIRNFQICNYANGIIAGSNNQTNAENLTLYNVNTMSMGDINSSYSGEGFLLGSMGSKFSNYDTLTNCLVVNSAAEGFGINGDKNMLTNCKVYCNENTANAATDYYIYVCGSYNYITNCHVDRAAGLTHSGHGIGAKSNAEQVIDEGLSVPVISPQYNNFYYNTATNMGESFFVRHRTVQYNVFYHCRAIGTHTGAKGSPGGEGNCIVTRDGASNNTFDGCIAENCNMGFVFVDSIEDGDTGANPPEHPGNKNKYINCLINNCYIGINFSNNGVQSDAGDNLIANCTFYKTRYIYYAVRHCANMKYVGNIYYGCLPNATGGEFIGGTYSSDIIPNGINTYFKNCNFINIEGGLPSNFLANSIGSITKDPAFINPSTQDFRLKSTSPCIDKSIAISDIKYDIDGFSRPQGITYDIGAHEYQVTTSFSATISSTSVKCYGGNNGSATVIPIGTAPYTYSWSNGQTTATITGLSSSNYSVTVTDNLGLKATASTTISQPPALAAPTASSNSPVYVGRSLSLKTTTIVPNATYNWSGPNSFSSSLQNPTITNVKFVASGIYFVTVADTNGCTSPIGSTSVTIRSKHINASIATTNVSCYGNKDGTASIIITEDTLDSNTYSYTWNTVPQQYTSKAVNLSKGTYKVTISDGSSSLDTTITITQPPPIILTVSVINNGVSFSATCMASGGTPSYSYEWNTAAKDTTPSVTGLLSGTYSVKLTDKNGCNNSQSITVKNTITEIEENAAKVEDNSELIIYPNPSKSQFFIAHENFEEGASILVVLYDIMGKEVYSKVIIKEDTTAVDTEDRLSPGIYVVTASSDDRLYKKKLVVVDK